MGGSSITKERDFDALKLLVDAAKNAGVPQEQAELYDYIVKNTTVKKYASNTRIVEDLSTATPEELTYPFSPYVPGGPYFTNAAVGADAAEEEELTPQHDFAVEFFQGYRETVSVTRVMGRAVARVPAPTHYGSVREGYKDENSHPFGVSLFTRLFSVEELGPKAAQAMAHEDALVILSMKKVRGSLVYEGELERIADDALRARVLADRAELAASKTHRERVYHGARRLAAPGVGPVVRRGDGYQVKVQRKGRDHWVDATDVDAINNASERAVAGFGSTHLSRLQNAETTKALNSGALSFREATDSWRRRESIGTVFRADALANVDDGDDGDDECASASSPAGPGAALELAKQSASRGDLAAVAAATSPAARRRRGADRRRRRRGRPERRGVREERRRGAGAGRRRRRAEPAADAGDRRARAALVAVGVNLDAAGTAELVLGSLEASGWSLVSSNVPRGRWDDLDFGASSDDDVCFENLLPFLGEGARRWTDATLPDEEAACYDNLMDYLSSTGVDFIRPSFAPPAPPTELFGIARGSRASAALLDAEARRRLGSTFEFKALLDMVNVLAFDESDVGKRLVELRLGLRATQPLVWDELRPMWCLAYLLEGEQATAAGLVLRPVTFQLSWAGMQNLPEIVKYYGRPLRALAVAPASKPSGRSSRVAFGSVAFVDRTSYRQQQFWWLSSLQALKAAHTARRPRPPRTRRSKASVAATSISSGRPCSTQKGAPAASRRRPTPASTWPVGAVDI
ncbi:hypothetical protein JL722_2872 [Aureococcus anophagefferens]|nr:hypothetical protein JL722_2872 [Aureococcus anophagefferens]